MEVGNNLFNARKKKGLSQEEVAEKLGVSRQTISKWELDETLPDIRQSKRLAILYGLSLDELITFDIDVKEIQEVIEKMSEEKQQKIDWTKTWGEKYPVLTTYQQKVELNDYIPQIKEMLDNLKREYAYNDLDAFLVLKDILAQIWNEKENR
ncbi:MAG: helix-turn-helix transcriptional regulator [Coprobacillaceae bacterium]